MITKSDATVEGIQSSRQTLVSSTDKHDALTSKLSGLLGEMKNLVDESRSTNQVVRGVASDLQNVEAQIKSDLAENVAIFDAFQSQMVRNNNSMQSTLSECEIATKSIQSNVSEMVRVGNSNEDSLVASLAQMDTNFVEQKNSLTDTFNEMFNKIENRCEMTRINIDGGLQGMLTDVSAEQDRIDAHQFEFDDTMNTLDTAQNEFHDTLQTDIGFLRTRMQTFQTDELQLYKSTGQTPSKREYHYPKVLAATSPHAKIIGDLWRTNKPEDLNCSAISIKEVSEAG